MQEDALPQRLATIMSIDVAGYSELTEADQAHTAVEVAALRRKIEALALQEHGRVFNTAGDGFMLEFPSAANALALANELCANEKLPLRIGILLGLFSSGIAFIGVFYAILAKLFDGHTVPGWASSLAIISFLFGVLFVFLAILAEYMGRILEEVRGRPRFIVSERLDTTAPAKGAANAMVRMKP
jgi:hypothetical protein